MLECWSEPRSGIVKIWAEAAGAPHIDDVVIQGSDSLAFEQLKHTSSGKNLTGKDLFVANDGPPLIAKLFRGWCRVRRDFALPIQVRLVTNASASRSQRNALMAPADFEESVLRPARAGQPFSAELMPVLEELRRLAGAAGLQEFIDFLRNLRIVTGAIGEGALRARAVDILRRHMRPRASAETEALAWVGRVYDLATDPQRLKPLDREDIDSELRTLFGLSARVGEHRLALPTPHVPRLRVAEMILEAAESTDSGYLLVLAPPGSGKTTLATWLANEFDDRLLLRYHVFDPRLSSSLERHHRASALTFVQTLFDVLEERFPSRTTPIAVTDQTVGDAVGALRDELAKIAADGPRIVLVDGIDHVVRSNMTRESLFDALPNPAPARVVFVLFGQPAWAYPNWLRQQRSIVLPPFSSGETLAHITERMGWPATNEAVAAIAAFLQQRTEGNPLSLFYNLATLEKVGGEPEAIAGRLGELRLFGASPHAEYGRLLDDVEAQLASTVGSPSFRRELLALFAVAGAAVTEDRLVRGFAEEGLTARIARDTLERLRPVIREQGFGRYWLFHDDFRRFAEERTTPQDRTEAHGRMVRALEADWQGEELKALAEHLWRAGASEKLSKLPMASDLSDWLLRAPKRTVLDMYRLALAGALERADELAILRNALAATAASEAVDEARDGAGGNGSSSALVGWSFAVVPRVLDQPGLRRRAEALRAATNGWDAETGLAAEIASRFMLTTGELEGIGEDADRELGEYLGGLVGWLLQSGELEAARRVAEDPRRGFVAATAFREALTACREISRCGAWVKALAGAAQWLDSDMVGVALYWFSNGELGLARAVVEALVASEICDRETRRDAAAMLAILGDMDQMSPQLCDAGVRWAEISQDGAANWCEFFSDGVATAMVDDPRDLSAYVFGDHFGDDLKIYTRDRDIVAFLWRSGCACGLAIRGEGLLTAKELDTIWPPLLGRDLAPDDYWQVIGFRRCAEVYFPLIALAVSRDPELVPTARSVIAKAAADLFDVPSGRTYGVLEALWTLDPGAWRTLARRACEVQRLPGSDGTRRAAWFAYWQERCEVRGIEIPVEWRKLVTVAALGVPRKTYPASLPISLLERIASEDHAGADRVRRLTELLVRLNEEPEGERGASHDLPRVLSIALKEDPGLFVDEFLFTTSEHDLREPFGDLAAELGAGWLASTSALSSPEALGLWHWVTSCPGSFCGEALGPTVGRAVCEYLNSAGATQEAQAVQSWLSCLTDSRRSGVQLSTSPTEGQTEIENGPTIDDSWRSAVRQTPKSLDEVSARWFSSWWSEQEYQLLRQALDSGGDPAWRRVCHLVAQQLAEASELSWSDCDAIAQGVPELRPRLDLVEAFDIACNQLTQRVLFQSPVVRAPQAGASCPWRKC